MNLRRNDFGSETWHRIEEIWRARLVMLTDQISQPGVDPERTAHLRGQIEEVRYTLSLPEYLERSEARAQEIELGDISAFY